MENNMMKPNDLSKNAIAVLSYLNDNKTALAREIKDALNIKHSTLRDSLNRIEAFGFVDVLFVKKSNTYQYKITEQGRSLIRQLPKEEKVVNSVIATSNNEVPKVESTEPNPITLPTVNQDPSSPIYRCLKQSPDLVSWLRSMSEAFNQMADSLIHCPAECDSVPSPCGSKKKVQKNTPQRRSASLPSC